jgi:aspartyl-tRNA(Asn)/glutamyl-tRNA(Gln) amidotransferase subunit A
MPSIGATTRNPHFGSCRNPWDPQRIPGGSSGGSGAALAADMTLAAIGTDTGGSVRIPAALNGVSGIRPTVGRVSIRNVVPVSWTFDTIGQWRGVRKMRPIFRKSWLAMIPQSPPR